MKARFRGYEPTRLTVAGSHHLADDLVPLFPQVVVVVSLHVLLEVPDVVEPAVADRAHVLQVLAQR